MLYREIIAVCSQIHTKHTNTLCGQNVEFLNVKPSGTYSNHWVLKVCTWLSIGSAFRWLKIPPNIMQTSLHAYKNVSGETPDSTATSLSAAIYGQCLGQHTAVAWRVVTEKQRHLTAVLSVFYEVEGKLRDRASVKRYSNFLIYLFMHLPILQFHPPL
jgi:hypothetical protein